VDVHARDGLLCGRGKRQPGLETQYGDHPPQADRGSDHHQAATPGPHQAGHVQQQSQSADVHEAPGAEVDQHIAGIRGVGQEVGQLCLRRGHGRQVQILTRPRPRQILRARPPDELEHRSGHVETHHFGSHTDLRQPDLHGSFV
jgi:hypothetical protein